MFAKGTLEEVLITVSKPSFSIDHSIYRPVIESLVNIGILQAQQAGSTYDRTAKKAVMDSKIVKKYEIVASIAFTNKEKGQTLLEQLQLTNLDFEDIRREGSKIIQIAKSKLPIHGRNYVEIHYGFYGISTLSEFSKE